jgi:hypothetical protein
MRMPWHKSKNFQLDLLDPEPEPNALQRAADPDARSDAVPPPTSVVIASIAPPVGVADGRPMQIAITLLYEDANNPRTEFPDADLDELAADLNALIRMLRTANSEGAERYRASAMSLATDVRRHLDLASRVIARTGGKP